MPMVAARMIFPTGRPMPEQRPLTLQCPTCNKTLEWSDEYPYRPFCSERCKLIDLGDWASERHAIPGEPAFDEEAPDGMGEG